MTNQLELFSVETPRCPCGWVQECVYWCGPGHHNGMCPPLDKGLIRDK